MKTREDVAESAGVLSLHGTYFARFGVASPALSARPQIVGCGGSCMEHDDVEVFVQTVAEGCICYSGAEFDSVLGGAGALSMHVLVETPGPSATCVTAELEVASAGRAADWSPGWAGMLAMTEAGAPAVGWVGVTERGGGRGRVRVTSNGSAARVRVMARGKSHRWTGASEEKAR